jgi:hypothetical protein
VDSFLLLGSMVTNSVGAEEDVSRSIDSEWNLNSVVSSLEE